jgi:transposase
MSLLTLSLSERRALEKEIQHTKDVKVLKRAQALLWLADGISAQELPKRLGVSQRTVYGWVSLYQNRRSNCFISRLQDQPKPGRPPQKSVFILRELPRLLQESPRQHGYHNANWTSSLLQQALQCENGLTVSTRTIRYCLKDLDYVWRRPTYSLSRQSPTWRQEKGGSKKVSTRIQGL